MIKNNIKRRIVVALTMIIAVTSFSVSEMLASMPVQDSTAIGEVYDGVNFNELENNGVYFGSYSQMRTNASNKEGEVTPILWRIVGEDGNVTGSTMDGSLTLFSEYVLDTSVFSGFGVESYSYSTFSGEAAYDTSYVREWLNEEDLYDYYAPNSAVLSNPNAYGYKKPADRDGFLGSFKITDNGSTIYNAELNAITPSTVSTYFIAQGTTTNSEVLIENPGSIKTYNSGYTQGTWESYFAGYFTAFSGWPTAQTNQYVYLPSAIMSYSGHARHNKVFWNADGALSATDGSTDYSLGPAGSDLAKSTTKYGTTTGYWTRSPEAMRTDSGSIRVYVVSGTTGNVSHASARNANGGVRPLTKLDPKTILMTHEIIGETPTLSDQFQADKENDSFWNYAVGKDSLTNYKLTLVSDNVELNSLKGTNDEVINSSSKLTLESGSSFKVVSDDYIGDYLAYKIVRTNASGEREIVAYGTSKGANPDELEIKGIKSTIDNSDLEEGNYSLYIWSQGEDSEGLNNTSVHSYEGSKPMTFELVVQANEPITTYTITYDGNENTKGTAPVDSASPYDEGASVKVLGKSDLEKEGYTFKGWSTTAKGSVEYEEGDTLTITSNMTLYAIWEEKTPINRYTAIFESNGGSSVASQTGMNIGDYINEPTKPTKEGYEFKGWYLDDNTFMDKWDFVKDTISGDTTLYAKWIKIEAPVEPNTPETPNEDKTSDEIAPRPSETTTTQKKEQASSSVVTADTANPMMYVGFMILAFLGVICVSAARKEE
ncbi:putative repeat protein (TIGR02543 family) [Breznakia sp. PF5-3]|uniref:InlB B-repeat-containing protein n=1 Tax=unclassified Breznakia TaxID=2623764 RepID=UPI00240675C6|nr:MULTISPECIES: InlB B-repeat-containing protein [unclassified Breznakia]MDF9825870.1 putative repeat protein (TIGR02543 family) [Breznakia sp. PM6-1]MDF9836666.1 putative repeat protein (TIGR02543 family) [Breznakia sp. PF5-3]MDF9838939.1 putative repeat protein (TIGR02543 family) [Breznakia sp. PFB2-8]MDF9860966.1 putative repeat protein (TIGR02543 family) [Breznakia sp. PH5-24]